MRAISSFLRVTSDVYNETLAQVCQDCGYVYIPNDHISCGIYVYTAVKPDNVVLEACRAGCIILGEDSPLMAQIEKAKCGFVIPSLAECYSYIDYIQSDQALQIKYAVNSFKYK
jgi:hypothetical protein